MRAHTVGGLHAAVPACHLSGIGRGERSHAGQRPCIYSVKLEGGLRYGAAEGFHVTFMSHGATVALNKLGADPSLRRFLLALYSIARSGAFLINLPAGLPDR